jgi:phage N-6-adenine-methyltransferase
MSDQPHNSDSDAGVEWGTPKKYVLPLADVIGGFDLDPASGAEPVPYADERYTKEDNGMAQDWHGHVWLNPPYGRKHNGKWAKKAYNQSPKCKSITALVPASTSTDWFSMYYSQADVFCFVDERIEFIGAGEDGASFANVICVFNAQNLPKEYFEELSRMGNLLKRVQISKGSVFEY